jgi:Family of unknown function (DUF5908)
MPVIINELIIRATVGNDTANSQGATAGSGTGTAAGAATDRERLVAQCVEQVLEILEKKRER